MGFSSASFDPSLPAANSDAASSAFDEANTASAVAAAASSRIAESSATWAGGGLANIVEDTTPELGGELDAGAHSIGFTQQAATGDGTTTIDWKLGNKFKFTFGAFNETFTFTAPSNPCNILLVLIQDGVGSRTATWPGDVVWIGGIAPVLSTSAAAVDIVSFYWDGTSYYGVASISETYGSVSDTVYGAGWDGVTTIAPSKNAVYDKVETLMDLDGGNLAIGSDADGDVYYRASAILTRLAKGAANTKLFMNAGATAPEWAAGMKIITATRDTTAVGAPTNVAYTGVGFKPSAIIALAVIDNTDVACWGFSDPGRTCHSIASNRGGVSGIFEPETNYLLYISVESGAYQRCAIPSYDSDGFTLAWTKAGLPTGTATIYFLCFR